MQSVPFGNLGFDVSRLGFGAMRLPTIKAEENTVIDRPEAIKMIRYAIDQGVNYMDTAYGYHNEESEVVMGLALKEGYREKVTLTTKLPHWVVHEKADLDKVLDKQLKKLDVPYVDFYILHALNKAAFEKLTALDFQGFYKRALKDGRIKHTGFSFHDEYPVFHDILTSFDFELAQVQFNYLDEDKQATLQGVKEAGKRGVPVVVMEPLRGGALAQPPQNVKDKIEKEGRGLSPVEWAFRYILDRPEVVTILSGMSTMEQLSDNLRIFSSPDCAPNCLTKSDHALLRALREEYEKRMPIGCTHCDYCQPCPKNVKIPDLFAMYNEANMFDHPERFVNGYKGYAQRGEDASKCVACRQCEKICPQQLPIISWLKTLRTEAEK